MSAAQERVADQIRTKGRQPKRDQANGAGKPSPASELKQAAAIAAAPVHAAYLLRPFLEREAMVLMFGEPGALKSFLALHWSMLVAESGQPVVYLHAEGKGLWARLRAWALHHHPRAPWNETLARLPFYALERPVNLSSGAIVSWLLKEIHTLGIRPALLIVDTLSRNSDGTAERGNEDMVAYLNRIDRDLRAQMKASVLFVHHPGHGNKDRARGPFSLIANTDASFCIERSDPKRLVIRITSGRMKDAETPAPAEMAATVVDVGELDDKGLPITSLAFERATTDASPDKPKARGKNQEKALTAMREWHRTHPDARHITTGDLKSLLKAQGMTSRGRQLEVTQFLVAVRILTAAIGGHTVDPEAL